MLADAHQKVVRLDVTIYEVTGMNVLDLRNLNKKADRETFKVVAPVTH